jgi:hypothetical protein
VKRWQVLAVGLLATAVHAEEFSFDASEFEKKPFEFGGYLELKADRAWLNRNSSFYMLNGLDRSTLDRNTATLKLDARYTRGDTSLNVRGSAEVKRDNLLSERTNRFDESYISFKPDPGFTLDVGKVVLKWGKGYAWNPVGFVERPKDPNDPELAREGFTMLAADFIGNVEGDLKTVAFTPVLLPAGNGHNSDFGKPNHLNPAAKLYLLWHDTDIDFMWLGSGSRTARFGVDFSRNLTSALEIHAEWARIRNHEQRSVNAVGALTTRTSDVTSYLFGLRYLTESDTTWIAEFYRNGTGYSESQLADFHALVAGDNPLLFGKAQQISPAYARANAGRDYLYLRISQKEPFDVVYLTPSITAIVNVADRSGSLTPELLYTGITNLDLRLRASLLHGRAGSDFGEKQNERRLELMARIYF